MNRQMNMVMDDRLAPEQDVSRCIYELVLEFKDGVLVLPEFQRDFKWNISRRRSYVKRLSSPKRPVGVFVTYELRNGRNGLTYMADGGNRIRTLLELLLEPERYGYSEEDARNLLKKRLITVQHYHYDDHMEGYVDFQLINLGLGLTSYEFNKGILATMEDYHTLWRPVIEGVWAVLDTSRERVVAGSTKNANKLDVLRRDALATFYRFIGQVDERFEFRINAVPVAQDVWERRSFEWRLRERLHAMGVEGVRQEVKRFERFVAEETALIEKIIYHDMGWSRGKGIALGLYRWLLAVAVWRRNNKVPVKVWEAFVSGLIREGQGAASIYFEQRTQLILSYQRLNELGRASEVAGVDLTVYRTRKREARTALKSGWQHSHEAPVSHNGDGPTVPEPGLLNMARGARPMTEEEKSSLT